MLRTKAHDQAGHAEQHIEPFRARPRQYVQQRGRLANDRTAVPARDGGDPRKVRQPQDGLAHAELGQDEHERRHEQRGMADSEELAGGHRAGPADGFRRFVVYQRRCPRRVRCRHPGGHRPQRNDAGRWCRGLGLSARPAGLPVLFVDRIADRRTARCRPSTILDQLTCGYSVGPAGWSAGVMSRRSVSLVGYRPTQSGSSVQCPGQAWIRTGADAVVGVRLSGVVGAGSAGGSVATSGVPSPWPGRPRSASRPATARQEPAVRGTATAQTRFH